jgi:hypothetical protein
MKKKQQRRILRAVVTACAAATTISAFTAPSSSSSLLDTNQRKIFLLHSSNNNNNNPQEDPSLDEELDGYSRCLLSPWEAKRSVKNESRQYSIIDRKPRWQKPLSVITRGVKKVVMKQKVTKPGSLILVRCGESKWTKTGRFTGWGEYILINTHSYYVMRIDIVMQAKYMHVIHFL